MLEYGHIRQPGAVLQDAFFREQSVDTIYPLPQVTAAALEDKALPALHSPQIVCRDLLHFYIPPICITGPISSTGAAGAS